MFHEPYLETCCRSALHRLVLSGAAGRPPGLKDGPCLRRLAGMGLASTRPDGRYELTAAGAARHASEVARHRSPVSSTGR
ncbi:MAG TPA: hypothetical protein VMB34_19600 [Acetobacteraceae bacterium]|nr:hypothetical protein [Acetobacteraceae bacterium]